MMEGYLAKVVGSSGSIVDKRSFVAPNEEEAKALALDLVNGLEVELARLPNNRAAAPEGPSPQATMAAGQ
jgi:hypothetical protein